MKCMWHNVEDDRTKGISLQHFRVPITCEHCVSLLLVAAAVVCNDGAVPLYGIIV